MKRLGFPRVVGVVAVVYLLGMAVVFALLSVQSSSFAQHAQQTTGTVVALVGRAPLGSTREPRANARTPSLAPRVSYTVEGRTYEYTASHGSYRQRLRVGDTVTVLYAADDPETARLRGEERALGPLITVGFALSAIAVVALGVRARRRGPTVRAAADPHGARTTRTSS